MIKTNYTSNIWLYSGKVSGESEIRKEYESRQTLLSAQPGHVQLFLENQAKILASAFTGRSASLSFRLPEEVLLRPGQASLTTVPAKLREQTVGGLMNRIGHFDLRKALQQHILELEQSINPVKAVSAKLISHATAMYMVRELLPSGRTVRYTTPDGDEIPCLPEVYPSDELKSKPADIEETNESIVPFVPDALRFYLPQWIAFGSQDELLVDSLAEAEAMVASMQRFLEVLRAAAGLAPYMVIDSAYQQKRYGILGQLVNQGRAFCRYKTGEILKTIQIKAADGYLNRGFSLDLPYFDDQDLVIKIYSFVVIPAGFIMFVPAFVVRAVLEERTKIVQNTSLSPSTRKHLLGELRRLGIAFEGNNFSK